MGQLSLIGKDTVVLHHRLLNLVSCGQDLLTILLGVHFNPSDLSTMGPLLYFCIIHLKEKQIRAIKKSYVQFSHPVFQLHNMGENIEMHCGRVSNCLGCLVKMIVGTSPVQDSCPEQVEKNWIIDMSLINHLEPLCPSDHIGPEMIVKVEVWIHIPPPPVMNDCFVIWFASLHDPMEGILGDLPISVSVLSRRTKREITSYVEGQ